MSERGSSLSRRTFLRMVGAAGGSAAVHETLVALGLMRHPSAWAGPPRCEPGMGKGQTVVILGAGVGGLATAYWLQQCGYRCTILEAQDRVGGRSYTARRGDQVFEDGREPQTCDFDDDERLYVNLGPGRIPYHHRRVIDLCDKLGVALEVYVHTSDYNLHYMSEGRCPMDRATRRRRIVNDTQGYVAELLARAVNQNALDHDLSGEDKEKLLSLLKKFGDLNKYHRYIGSTRADCRELPVDVRTSCGRNVDDAIRPLGLDVLLDSRFWDPCIVGAPKGDNCDLTAYGHGIYQIKEHLWQTTSFQPVGGMDKIVQALTREVGEDSILRGARVTKIAYAENGGQKEIEVSYLRNNQKHTKPFDFCVSNIPLPVLKDVKAPHFHEDVRAAIGRLKFSDSCKVGWQTNERRFWEEDQHIYGGISWTDHPITQMWYPSNDYFWKGKKGQGVGVLTGAYNYAETAKAFGELSLQERLDLAHEGGALFHPQAFDGSNRWIPRDKGISIAWQNVPFQKGCSANWNSESDQDELDYERLLVPDMNQRFYVVGDQVSSLPGWQEGALMSAEHVVEQLLGRKEGREVEEEMLRKIREDVEHAPSSVDVMG